MCCDGFNQCAYLHEIRASKSAQAVMKTQNSLCLNLVQRESVDNQTFSTSRVSIFSVLLLDLEGLEHNDVCGHDQSIHFVMISKHDIERRDMFIMMIS